MTGAEILVTTGGLALIAGLAWFFFGPKQARRAEVRGGVQELEITVKGGYSPNLIRAQEERPRNGNGEVQAGAGGQAAARAGLHVDHLDVGARQPAAAGL